MGLRRMGVATAASPILIAGLAAVGFRPSPRDETEDSGGPLSRAESYDCGRIVPGEASPEKHGFQFDNAGKQDAHVAEGSTRCGCMDRSEGGA